MSLVTDKNAICPINVDLNNSKIILKDVDDDDDEDSDYCGLNNAIEEFDGFKRNGNVNFDNTVLTVEGSSDVNIGQITHFHGPVTIQSIQAGISNGFNNAANKKKDDKGQDNSDIEENGINLINSTPPPQPAEGLQTRNQNYGLKKFWNLLAKSPLARVLLLSSIIIIITMIILCLTLIKTNDTNQIYPLPDDNTDNNSTKIGNHSLIYRNAWRGKPPLSTRPLKHPTSIVIISHTVTPICTTILECSQRVLSIQEYHVNTRQYPDISYNFLIGGDGNIYVGRDWDTINEHRDDSIGISFIGNYGYDHLTDDMIDAALKLLEYGVDNMKLHEDYALVGHNQTKKILSPGKNVYAIIKEWPHFKPDRLF